jgi:antitoxin YefM
MPCELYRVPVQEEDALAIRTTYTQARANLARLCDEATDNREVVIISRRSGEDVALVAASELAGLTETAHLLRSPKNAERLLKAMERAKNNTVKPQTVDELRRELGVEQEK